MTWYLYRKFQDVYKNIFLILEPIEQGWRPNIPKLSIQKLMCSIYEHEHMKTQIKDSLAFTNTSKNMQKLSLNLTNMLSFSMHRK